MWADKCKGAGRRKRCCPPEPRETQHGLQSGEAGRWLPGRAPRPGPGTEETPVTGQSVESVDDPENWDPTNQQGSLPHVPPPWPQVVDMVVLPLPQMGN